ncbi:hypothetical protein AB0I60_03860 [Actinosynnema sp. NPDC050436]|uniref:hypothetical protein n=1 Tax=Actinosynnema sp. NPDC050436 TaxID=3155659 RepID=UPI0034087465
MRLLAVPTAVLALVLVPPVAEASVEFEELHRFGYASAIAEAVNESGQVAGRLNSPDRSPRSVRWDARGTVPAIVGSARPIGVNARGDVLNAMALKSAGALIYSLSAWENGAEVDRTPYRRTTHQISSRDINDSGVIPVGYRHFDDVEAPYGARTRAGAWRGGKYADLPLPKARGVDHRVVNNRGTTAGSLTLLDGSANYAFRCSATRCTRLPGLSSTGHHEVLALNESDVLAGTWHADHPGPSRALVWAGDRVTALPGDDARVADNPRAINESGDVVGWRVVDGVRKAALWRGGQPVDLGTTGEGEAVAVNDRGDVVGWHTTDGKHKVFYWRTGTLTELRTPADVSAEPVGLNNAGVVVGNNDPDHWPPAYAYRWTVRLP